MRDLQDEQVSSKRPKTFCPSDNSSSEASVSVPCALNFSSTSTCSSPVTAALGTTEGNVMPPIAGPSETDGYSFQETPSAPTPPVQTSTPVQSVQSVSGAAKKERPWQKNTTAWKSGLLNCKKNLSCCKLLRYFFFSFTITFKFLKCMKFYR